MMIMFIVRISNICRLQNFVYVFGVKCVFYQIIDGDGVNEGVEMGIFIFFLCGVFFEDLGGIEGSLQWGMISLEKERI